MRAKFINENIYFQRGKDPLKSMGLGAIPTNPEIYVKYLISKLPKILGHIPNDIIFLDGIKWLYTPIINKAIMDDCEASGIEYKKEPNSLYIISINNDWKILPEIFERLVKSLKDMGYRNFNHVYDGKTS
jgi:hypothetical protein